MNLMTQYPIDGDPARGVGFGLVISTVCWIVIYAGVLAVVWLLS